MSTSARRTTTRRILEREPIGWTSLLKVMGDTLGTVSTFVDWKGAIVDRVIEQGFSLPIPATFDRAMDRCVATARRRRDPRAAWLWTPPAPPLAPAPTPHDDPTIRHRPATPDPPTWTSIDRLASPTSSACGASKHGSAMRPLRCNRPDGHDGDHGMSVKPGGVIFVRWAREALEP
jgi:hypothetical protein